MKLKKILFIALLFSAFDAWSQSKLPQIIEVIGKAGKPLNSAPLFVLRAKNAMHGELYQWQNHLVIYGELQTQQLIADLKQAYPRAEVKTYADPFYNFNRAKHCKGSKVAREWTNILLTANLVNSPKLQNEYLHYHATQFSKWPEVSQGFCNADFQQLLVYRTGRQLMLVISIPKGKTLDELNPKTTEHNPRVNDWNNIMKKYQEGLPGTKPGEVWVFLKPISNKILR